MGERKRIVVLAAVMTLIVVSAVALTASALYRIAVDEEKERLREAVESQARLMEAIAEHENAPRQEGTAPSANDILVKHTLKIFARAHAAFKGFGRTGEFTLGKREGDNVIFLLRHRHHDLDKPHPIQFSSNLAEPMRRALSGQSGTDICLDYRGEPVIAAFEPVKELGLGLVAKIDLAEVRAPFIRAGMLIGVSSLALIAAGIFLFVRIGNPIVQRLEENERKYRLLSEDLDKEVKRKVAELQQAERMAALGRMVSVVAHEVRNPLQHIRFGVDTLEMFGEQDKDTEEILDEIRHGVAVLDEIIGELLEYSRPVSLKYASVRSGNLVRQALTMLSRKLDHVSVRVELEHEEREIAVDPVKMSQVLVNVISNGIEAMNHGGNIRISSKFFVRDDSEYLLFAISDDGPGMTEETLNRMEEPFFTTKALGTGLGIPICRKIIDAHNGSLNVRSNPGDGTTVELTLPVRCHGQADAPVETVSQP